MSDLFEQPSFEYSGTTGYVPDSDTSVRHSQFEKQRAGQVQNYVLRTLTQSETSGATSPEVEQQTGLTHQTVSAAIRNMELDGYEKGVSRGKVTKLRTTRNGCHAYVATSWLLEIPPSEIMEPNARRVSWKKRLDEVINEIESVAHYPEPFLANYLKDLIAQVRAEL